MIRLLTISLIFAISIFSLKSQDKPVVTIDSVSVNPETNVVTIAWNVDKLDNIHSFKFLQWIESPSNDWIPTGQTESTVEGVVSTVTGAVHYSSELSNLLYGEPPANEAPVRLGVGYLLKKNGQIVDDGDTPLDYGGHKTMYISEADLNLDEGEVKLNWTPYGGWEQDLKEYSVYIGTEENSVSIPATEYTTVSSESVEYVFADLDPDVTYTFFIRAKNKNGATSSSNAQKVTTPNNFALNEPELKECAGMIKLSWEPVKVWAGRFEKYNIYAKKEGDADFVLLDYNGVSQLNYEHKNPTSGAHYTYCIEAVKGDKKIRTETKEIFADIPKFPDKMDLLSVSTLSSTEIMINIDVDTDAGIEAYQVVKSTELGGEYKTVVASAAPNEMQNNITDEVPSTEKPYFYKLQAVQCDTAFETTKPQRNIVVTQDTEHPNEDEIKLQWNEYINWEDGVNSYSLYRSVNGGEVEFIANVNVDETMEYIDDVSSIKNDESKESQAIWAFCYYVIAAENSADIEPAESKSNEKCVTHTTGIIMPNAFNPLSEFPRNRTFKPILPEPTKYQFLVFNRWGVKIFETTDYNEGWDGHVNKGELAAEGTYIYHLTYTIPGGGEQTKIGHVTVVFP